MGIIVRLLKNRYVFVLILIITGSILALLLAHHTSAVGFPTTPVLDNFNRSGTTSPPSSSWSAGQGDNNSMELAGDSVTANASSTANLAVFDGNYWNVSTFGPDTEVYATISTASSSNTTSDAAALELYGREQNPTVNSSFDGYELVVDGQGSNNIQLYEILNGNENSIGNFTQTWSLGDSFGMKITGSSTVTVQAWYKPSSGSWTSLGSDVDGNSTKITVAGYIGVDFESNRGASTPLDPHIDDFGGGTVSTNSPPNAPTLATPTNSATGVLPQPTFTLSATDPNNDYVDYEIQVCSTSNCSSVVYTACEVSGLPNTCSATSQTGWQNQNANSGAAYSSGSTATYVYQGSNLSADTQYWWQAYAIDPGGSDTASSASSIFSFTTDQAPAAPTLITPTASATGIATIPLFQLRTTDAEGDYLDYEIQICSTSTCSSVVATYCQVSSLPNSCTGSQTGWTNQNLQSDTAYIGSSTITGSTIANFLDSTTSLTPNTQYWWRGYAIDPGGSQTASSASSIGTFTTASLGVIIGGSTTIGGNTTIY